MESHTVCPADPARLLYFSLSVYPNRIGHRPQKQSQRLRWEEEGGRRGGGGISLHIHPSLSRLFVSHPRSFSKRRGGGEAGTNSVLLFLHLSPLLRSFHETEWRGGRNRKRNMCSGSKMRYIYRVTRRKKGREEEEESAVNFSLGGPPSPSP